MFYEHGVESGKYNSIKIQIVSVQKGLKEINLLTLKDW